MWKYFTISAAALAYAFVYVSSLGDENMIGKGRWFVLNIKKCPDDNVLLNTFNISRRKVNRTHDGFNANVRLDEDINSFMAIRVDICKEVDGGCKPYQVLSDKSFCAFINKYAKENFQKLLAKAGINVEDCPIPKGDYILEKYMFDYTELPEDGVYGTFGAKAFLIKGGRNYACVDINLEFKKDEDD